MFTDADTSKWAPHLSSVSPVPTIFFSGLATTRANAGGLENQRKLEHGVNTELAKAAQAAGTKIYVCISSSGADPQSRFPYLKMKGDIEEDVKNAGFEKAIILRPGFLIGDREQPRMVEKVFHAFAGLSDMVKLKDSWAVNGDVVAKAAVHAAILSAEGKAPEGKVWILNNAEIVKLGRTEWTDAL